MTKTEKKIRLRYLGQLLSGAILQGNVVAQAMIENEIEQLKKELKEI